MHTHPKVKSTEEMLAYLDERIAKYTAAREAIQEILKETDPPAEPQRRLNGHAKPKAKRQVGRPKGSGGIKPGSGRKAVEDYLVTLGAGDTVTVRDIYTATGLKKPTVEYSLRKMENEGLLASGMVDGVRRYRLTAGGS